MQLYFYCLAYKNADVNLWIVNVVSYNLYGKCKKVQTTFGSEMS